MENCYWNILFMMHFGKDAQNCHFIKSGMYSKASIKVELS